MTRLRQYMLEDLQRHNYPPGAIGGNIRAVEQFAEYIRRSAEQMGVRRAPSVSALPAPAGTIRSWHHFLVDRGDADMLAALMVI